MWSTRNTTGFYHDDSVTDDDATTAETLPVQIAMPMWLKHEVTQYHLGAQHPLVFCGDETRFYDPLPGASFMKNGKMQMEAQSSTHFEFECACRGWRVQLRLKAARQRLALPSLHHPRLAANGTYVACKQPGPLLL